MEQFIIERFNLFPTMRTVGSSYLFGIIIYMYPYPDEDIEVLFMDCYFDGKPLNDRTVLIHINRLGYFRLSQEMLFYCSQDDIDYQIEKIINKYKRNKHGE